MRFSQLTRRAMSACMFTFALLLPWLAFAQPVAQLELGTAVISGDNNRLDPNDCNQLTLPLRNVGAADATAISATLTSSTPGVVITQGTSGYPNIVATTGTQNNATPFQVSTDGSIPNGTIASFTLTVTYVGGPSPVALNFTLQVGVNTSNYQFTPTATGAAIPAGGTLVAGTGVDDAVATITLPFDVRLYGTTFAAGSSITASTNGNIQFVASGGSDDFVNIALPAGSAAIPPLPAAAPAIFPYWDDLILTTPGGGIYVNTVGTAPNRQFVVEWRGRRIGDGATTQNMNVAVIFTEGASAAASPFRMVYVQTGVGTTANGASATVGVQQAGAAGSNFTQYSLNQGVITAGLILDAALPVATPGAGTCAPPSLTYAPATPGPIGFTGVGVAGSNGTASIAVTPSGGNGTGPVSTTTLGTCTFGGTHPASFALGTVTLPLSFVGNTTTTQNLPLSCTSAAAARTATLTCQETRGSTAPVARQWDLNCPAGTCPAITVNPTTLPNATVGTAYNQTITQTGGAGTVGFTVTAGALPGGITLATNGALSGTPTANGTFTFTVTATDANGCTGTRAYTLIVDAVAPSFAYTPAAGSTVTATGGTTIGTTGALTITPSVATPGAGTGAGATTTLTCTAPTAPFTGFGQSISAIGAGAIAGGPLAGSCTLGATAATQTLTCQETRGTAAPVARTWTLSCPSGSLLPVTSTPASGGTLSLTGAFGNPAPQGAVAFTNPNPIAVSITCTAPTGGFNATSPLSFSVPANGSANLGISLPLGPGNYAGSLSCSVTGAAQTLSYTLNGTIAGAVPIDATSAWSRLVLLLLTLAAGLLAIGATRRT